MKHARSNHACAQLPNGEIWVGGGGRNGSTVEIYTVETDSWRWGPLLPGRFTGYPGVFVVSDENLFYVGGRGSSNIHKLNKEKNGWVFVCVYPSLFRQFHIIFLDKANGPY